jgi:hypothetical protein
MRVKQLYFMSFQFIALLLNDPCIGSRQPQQLYSVVIYYYHLAADMVSSNPLMENDLVRLAIRRGTSNKNMNDE